MFEKKQGGGLLQGFIMFSLIGVIGLGINLLLMYMLVDGLRIWYMLAKAVSMAVVLGWNFIARKKLVFR